MKMEAGLNNFEKFHNGELVEEHTKDADGWIEDIKYIDKELEDLLNLQGKMISKGSPADQLKHLKEKGTRQLLVLNTYKGAIEKVLECDTAACDTYYYESHRAHFQNYQDYVEAFKKLKENLFPEVSIGLEHHFQDYGIGITARKGN